VKIHGLTGWGQSLHTNNELNKQSLIGQIKTILASRMSARVAKQAAFYCDVYFKRVPLEELSRETPLMFAGMVAGQFDFFRHRKRGDLLIRVFNPEKERDGWDSARTIIELANDDMPFLVDTVSMVMQELNLGVHLIVHPVFNVERDADNKLKAFHPKTNKRSEKESFIQVHLERQTDPAVLASIESRLKSRMAKIRTTVTDWKPMRASLAVAIDEFGRNAPDLSGRVKKECVNFLKWVGNDHFMFIGARTYDIVQDDNTAYLKVVDGTGLGLLREHGKNKLSRPLTNLSDESCFDQNAPLIITKTLVHSPMHRSGYMDYIGVLRFDENGKVIGEFRFIGLFTSLAYRHA